MVLMRTGHAGTRSRWKARPRPSRPLLPLLASPHLIGFPPFTCMQERARLEEQRRATEQERSDLTQTIAALRRQRDHFSAQQTEYKVQRGEAREVRGRGGVCSRAACMHKN